MYLNKLEPQLPSREAKKLLATAIPDYNGLVRFLLQPFLESPNSLSVDSEIYHSTARVWIRVAFEGEDKGRVFGRGGRNIQAIRTVIGAAAALAGHSVYLDIYGSANYTNLPDGEEGEERLDRSKLFKQRESPKPAPKPRTRSNFS